MKKEQIIEKLNKIVVEDFKVNWNKKEYERLDGKHTELARELKKELQKEYGDNFEVTVGDNGLLIIYKVLSRDEFGRALQEYETIFPTVKTPYNYAMGNKVSKKVFNEWLAKH